MNDLGFLGDLVKILIPAACVMYAMYLVVKSFLNKEFERKLVELKIKNTEIILPLRLQAYERMALFLERISPSNLLLRTNQPDYTAAHLQHLLIAAIREEFNHNLSQQVYISEQTWKIIRLSMDTIITSINNAYKSLPGEARSIELAKKIMDERMQKNEDPVQAALFCLKTEIQKVF